MRLKKEGLGEAELGPTGPRRSSKIRILFCILRTVVSVLNRSNYMARIAFFK